MLLFCDRKYVFRGIQEYIALDANNIVSISGNIFLLYPPQGHPLLYRYLHYLNNVVKWKGQLLPKTLLPFRVHRYSGKIRRDRYNLLTFIEINDK